MSIMPQPLFEMGSHAEHCADGDDAGAADPIDDRCPALVAKRNWRAPNAVKRIGPAGNAPAS